MDIAWDIVRVLGAVAIALGLYLAGAAIVRNFANFEPPEDEAPAPLEDVDYRYQCGVCGAEAVLYSAPEGEVPEAPRHCREPMTLVG
ncbi:MAG: hypothetical protein ACT4OX_11770 [Actinomycetota bacterium]